MLKEIEVLVEKVRHLNYSSESVSIINNALKRLKIYIENNHFLRTKYYLEQIERIRELAYDLSESLSSREDELLQKNVQRKLSDLMLTVLTENKKIFVVHGRNHSMRDKLASVLGRLKLDCVILETEHNGGATIIEKFLRNAQDCRYAVVLFSADDVGRLNQDNITLKVRTRQNVILELGYFLSAVGRQNIFMLHEVENEIERPSDFDGMVYEPFDDYGAWKSKLIKEMKRAGIYIDQNLADRV